MQFHFFKHLLIFFNLVLIFSFLEGGGFEEQKKRQMIEDLEVIKHHFEAGYAPAEWKKEYSGWDLELAFEQAKNRILQTEAITTKQFQTILRDFINTMKDYHVDVLFFSTEAASLPFTVRGANGRYFFNWIDPLRLPPSHYAIREGDEIIQFDGRPINEVIEEIKNVSGKSASADTDQAFAELKLTMRSGMEGDIIPRGSVMIQTRRATSDKLKSYQLFWSYTPEYVKNPLDFLLPLESISKLIPQKKENLSLPLFKMTNPLHETYAKKNCDRNGGLGSNVSFIPLLGETLWVKENEDEDEEELLLQGGNIKWHAYIYRHPQGHSIGYIRIPHYRGFATQSREFGEILNIMEKNTDALVIDQVHNIGGYVSFQYELASMLAIEPLQTPLHRIKITQKEVFDAYKTLEFIKVLELIMQNEELNDPSEDKNDIEEESEDDDFENNFNYQEVLCLKDYYELVLNEWNKGNTLTRPTPILGIDRINPHPKYQYTKPILMLINEMCFSGGDMVPAILQDNQRATLFGGRTAGAGGFVYTFEFPNSHGIALCSYTASIAERTKNFQKIENLGVTPEIHYQITAHDLQNKFTGYVQAVNSAIHCLVEKEKTDLTNKKNVEMK